VVEEADDGENGELGGRCTGERSDPDAGPGLDMVWGGDLAWVGGEVDAAAGDDGDDESGGFPPLRPHSFTCCFGGVV